MLIASYTLTSQWGNSFGDHRRGYYPGSPLNIVRTLNSFEYRAGVWCSMMTSSNGTIFRVTGPLWGESPVTGGFPPRRPVTRSFGVFFDLHLNKRLSKQSDAGDLRRYCAHYQSGTKPNLVAKILATKFGGRLCRLPKLVAKISSKFQHLVNTGLDVGSGIKWLPLKVANTCKLDIIWVVYCSPILNGSIRL